MPLDKEFIQRVAADTAAGPRVNHDVVAKYEGSRARARIEEVLDALGVTALDLLRQAQVPMDDAHGWALDSEVFESISRTGKLETVHPWRPGSPGAPEPGAVYLDGATGNLMQHEANGTMDDGSTHWTVITWDDELSSAIIKAIRRA